MEKIIILDFGSQYTHLIARRIRELKVYSEILPFNVSINKIKSGDVKGIILSGGPDCVYQPNAPKPSKKVEEWILAGKIPVLGICYGFQLLAYMLGGNVEKGIRGEYGRAEIDVLEENDLFKGLPQKQVVWMSHGDIVAELPPKALALAKSKDGLVAAFKLGKIYGVQFHPEVKHTVCGREILRNFLFEVCKCEGLWDIGDIVNRVVEDIRKEASSGNVLMAVSGGVDSTTSACLIKMALGVDRIYLVVIDTGFLRENEAERAVRLYEKLGFKHIFLVDVKEKFISRLKGVVDPEEKRRLISQLYFEVLDEKADELAKEYGEFKYLGQGTIYPDRVESGATGRATARIKSHHNVVYTHLSKLVKLEPLKDLYKDEVRKIAELIGVPKEVIFKHPFPGPGLAIRIIGEVTEEKLKILRKVDKIVEEELRKAGIYKMLWQAFPVLLPIKTVGVMGDERTYRYAIALRAVISEDAMTAEFAKLPWNLLERLSSRIVNEVKNVNRVLYDITNKPPATIEYE